MPDEPRHFLDVESSVYAGFLALAAFSRHTAQSAVPGAADEVRVRQIGLEMAGVGNKAASGTEILKAHGRRGP